MKNIRSSLYRLILYRIHSWICGHFKVALPKILKSCSNRIGMGFLGRMFGRKPKVGRWVRDTEAVENLGYGQTYGLRRDLDTFSWNGPKPKNGQYPPKPVETLQAEAMAQNTRNSNARVKRSENDRQAQRNANLEKAKQLAADRQEEQEVCNAAIAELRAKRLETPTGGRRKTQRKRKQLQKRRKSYKRSV